jgi:LA2681-like HEPN
MPKTAAQLLDRLLTQDMRALPIKDAFHRIGLLIDISGDLHRDDGTARALACADELLKRKLRPSQRALIEYFLANAWANRQALRHRTDQPYVWAWEQPELQNQIRHLRLALTHAGFPKMAAIRRCQVMTNLANQLDTVGRFVEALEYWGGALTINPRFGMALGNRGLGLRTYAQALYDPGHQRVLLAFAHASLVAAIAPSAQYKGGGYESAKAFFQRTKECIEKVTDVARVMDGGNLEGHSLGASKAEQDYRRWCLQKRLFLNPLNDLGPYPIAAQDVFMLPSYVTAIDEPPVFSGFFNQMKQEFASARWLFYDAIHARDVHFSDRRVALHNTFDYPSYALAVEKMRIAFRVAYSLFDKIAVFLNAYMKLGINERNLYFRSLWYKNADVRQRILRPEFERFENWPMRGLYWLAKDLFEPGFRDAMQPDAQALYVIRNRLEHSYLKVHEMILPPPTRGHLADRFWTDRLAYSIQRQELQDKTMRVFKLSRAALIYLSLGMHREERSRVAAKAKQAKNDKSLKGVIAPITLPLWDDDQKR